MMKSHYKNPKENHSDNEGFYVFVCGLFSLLKDAKKFEKLQ